MFNNLPVSITENRPRMNALRDASLQFTCAHCEKEFSNRTPVRRSEFGPYFDTFYCAAKYFGNLGDEKSAAMARRLEEIRSK